MLQSKPGSKPEASAITCRPIPNAVKDFPFYPDEARIRRKAVAIMLDVHEMTLRRWEKAGILPPCRQVTPHYAAYTVGELRQALKAL